jgi:hypothetical protein
MTVQVGLLHAFHCDASPRYKGQGQKPGGKRVTVLFIIMYCETSVYCATSARISAGWLCMEELRKHSMSRRPIITGDAEVDSDNHASNTSGLLPTYSHLDTFLQLPALSFLAYQGSFVHCNIAQIPKRSTSLQQSVSSGYTSLRRHIEAGLNSRGTSSPVLVVLLLSGSPICMGSLVVDMTTKDPQISWDIRGSVKLPMCCASPEFRHGD